MSKELKNYYEFAFSKVGKDGATGATLEIAINDILTGKPTLHRMGETDTVMFFKGKNRRTEVKTNGGQLRADLKGNSTVVYAPYVNLEKDARHQTAYVILRTAFIKALKQSACYRESKHTSGNAVTPAVQTVYNYKTGLPHGKKMYALIDAIIANGGEKLSDVLDGQPL